ncbi:MAG: FliH/SctL family protein [Gemmataceae bacterium]
MTSEATIRLPSRLVGVVRCDPATEPPPPIQPMPLPSPTPSHQEIQDAEDRARLQALLAGLGRAAQALHVEMTKTLAEIKLATVDVALAVASHFMMERIQAGTFPFETLVTRALERLAPARQATVLVHPDDLRLLQERAGAHPSFTAVDLRWLADASLPRGSFRIETMEQSVLFDVGNRFELLRQTLRQSLE